MKPADPSVERPAAQHGGLRLTLAVTGDGMGAKLRIEGHDNRAWREAYGTASRLNDVLLEQGLAEEGLRADMVGWIAETLCRTTPDSRERDLREAQSVEVARGRAPLHEEPVGLAFHKSYITDAAVIADLRRAAGDSGTWDAEGLRDRVDPACWVAIGAVIVSWQGTARGMNGMDVFGAPIPAQGLAERLPSFGKSAGDRLIVMRLGGSARPIAASAARTRSRLSATALSGRPTMMKAGSPEESCTCTSTARASSPRYATVATVAAIRPRPQND